MPRLRSGVKTAAMERVRLLCVVKDISVDPVLAVYDDEESCFSNIVCDCGFRLQ